MRFVSSGRTVACFAIVPPFAAAVATAVVFATSIGTTLPAAAQGSTPPLRLLAGTAGTPSDTTLDMAHELATVLAAGRGPRLMPMLGSGGASDAADLAALPDIDVAILPTIALAAPPSGNAPAMSIEGRIGILAKLHDAELHILGAPGITSISDLAGRTVNVGPAGSGSATIARDVLSRLGVETTPINVSFESGLAKLAAGEIAATVLLTGKPARALVQRTLPPGVHLLDIPFAPELDAHYLPAAIQAHDYPGLVTDGTGISTIAVGVVIAARMPDTGSGPNADVNRAERLDTFVGALTSALQTLQEGHHPKWRDVNFVASLAGWPRHPAAERWLAAQRAAQVQRPAPTHTSPTALAAATSPAAERPDILPAVPPQPPATTGTITPRRASAAIDPMLAFAEAARAAGGNAAEQERLFKIFLEQNKSRPPNQTAVSAVLP